MAKTIPQLTDATTVNAADELIIQQGGITKRATGAELAKGLNAINGTVNVKDFGAVGDGVADDTVSIQAALNSGSKKIYIPSGTYRVTASLFVPSNVEIQGDGRFTILQLAANFNVLYRGVLSINGTSNVKICDLSIDGQRGTYSSGINNAIDVNWTTNSGGAAGNSVTVERVYINNMGGAGIQCLASAATPSSNVTISFCEVSNTGAHGIIAQDYISDVYFCNNRIKNYALSVSDRVGITAARNGVRVLCSNNLVECSSSAVGSSCHGISMDNTKDVTVVGNVVVNAVGYGIEIGYVENGAFSNNSISGGIRSGIAFAGSSSTLTSKNISVTGNSVRNQPSGIYFGKESGLFFAENISISNNVIVGCSLNGIDMNAVDRLSIAGNSVSGCTLSGIYVLDCKNWIVSANSVVANNVAGIKDVVSITRTGSTATATVTGHGYNNGDIVTIFGANPSDYNGSFVISNVATNTFDVAVASSVITTPAVGNITCSKPNNAGHAGIRGNYVALTEKNTGAFGNNYTYQNGLADVWSIGYNGFTGPVDDKLYLKETSRPRVENLTSGESANILDRAALYVSGNNVVIAYNNSGTINYLSCPLNGTTNFWSSGTAPSDTGTRIRSSSTTLSALSGATATATNLIPAGSIVLGVAARVLTTVTGATSFDIGDGTDTDRWGDNIAVAADTVTGVASFTITSVPIYSTATSVVLTANGSNFTGGSVRLVVSYIDLNVPSA
jgi:parallel beta-helix repeat protein